MISRSNLLLGVLLLLFLGGLAAVLAGAPRPLWVALIGLLLLTRIAYGIARRAERRRRDPRRAIAPHPDPRSRT
ncbi:MAG: hypothetical protein ABR599_13160 [Gemmatimonadota bacterium]